MPPSRCSDSRRSYRARGWAARWVSHSLSSSPRSFSSSCWRFFLLPASIRHEGTGSFHPKGVWYYSVVWWLAKTPVFVLIATLLGIAVAVRGKVIASSREARFLGIALLLHLASFSLLFHTQIGYRFVLMCLPMVYTLAAGGLTLLPPTAATRWAAAIVLVVSLAENAAYLGNPLAFTNAGVWPKTRVYQLMADSQRGLGPGPRAHREATRARRRETHESRPAACLARPQHDSPQRSRRNQRPEPPQLAAPESAAERPLRPHLPMVRLTMTPTTALRARPRRRRALHGHPPSLLTPLADSAGLPSRWTPAARTFSRRCGGSCAAFP